MPGSGILATIGGAMLQFSRDDYVVVPQSLNTDPARVIVALVEGGGGSFSVIDYEYGPGAGPQGEDQAKVTLQTDGSFPGFMATGETYGEIQNPLVIAETPTEFILTNVDGNDVTFQSTSAPPPPFVQVVPASSTLSYLAYGFDGAFLQGSFTLSVVG
jgi:hypothetical protein